MFPTLEDGVVGMRDEVLEMGLLIRRRRNLVLPTVTCDKLHIVCDRSLVQRNGCKRVTTNKVSKAEG